MSKEKIDYKISYLELVGEMYTGAGVMVIVKHDGESYESLFWVSPDESVKDRLIMPLKFLQKEGIKKMTDHPKYDELISETWRVLPATRESIFKEIE